MRNTPIEITRLAYRGRKLGGGYLVIGSLLNKNVLLPTIAPKKNNIVPNASTYKIGLPIDNVFTLHKLKYKNVSPGRNINWPRRRLIRTTGRPLPRNRASFLSDMKAININLTENPITKHSYFGRASFRFWVIYWYWGLDKKYAHESKIAYHSVKVKKLSFSKWPRNWIGSRQEHSYITNKAGKMYFLYHADSNSLLEVISAICYTLILHTSKLEAFTWPLLWINAKVVQKEKLLAIINSSLIKKLIRQSDWPPIVEFVLNYNLESVQLLINQYSNKTTVDFYDNIIVCAYPKSKPGMYLAKYTWSTLVEYLKLEDRVERRIDKKLLTIPSEIPVSYITIPPTEALLPRKKLFPSYFFGHGLSSQDLANLKQTKPWAVEDNKVILLYKRFKKRGHRGALRRLIPNYYEEGVKEARRTDIRGMRYDIRMVEHVSAVETKLINANLDWAPTHNIIALGTWQALPRMFNNFYWLGFTRIKIITNPVNVQELHYTFAYFVQMYNTNSLPIGNSAWFGKSLNPLRKGTWFIGPNKSSLLNYCFYLLFSNNYYLNHCWSYFPQLNMQYHRIMTKRFFNKFRFAGNKTWVCFFNLSRLQVGIAYTLLAYLTYNLRNKDNYILCWHSTEKPLPNSFFTNDGWTNNNTYKFWRKLKHNWLPMLGKSIRLCFNRNSWNTRKVYNIYRNQLKFFKFNWSRYVYKLKYTQSSIKIKITKTQKTRINSIILNMQSCNVWTHLKTMPINYPNMRPIKTILNNWTTLLTNNNYKFTFTKQFKLPVEACSAQVLRTWLQIRPDATFRRLLGFRSLKLNSLDFLGFPLYNIGAVRIIYTKPGCTSDWDIGLAAWPKWLGYGRGWTGHVRGNWIPLEFSTKQFNVEENWNLFPIKQTINKLPQKSSDFVFIDGGYWIYLFFRAPLGTWQALAIASLLGSELRSNLLVTQQIQIWHGGLALPFDFFCATNWDSSGRYKWPERLILIWHRTTIAWVERRVRGRRKYNRRYSKLPSETIARSIQVQNIRIRFPNNELSLSYFAWLRQHFIYPYGKKERDRYLHRAEVELSLRWSQYLRLEPISGDDK